MKYLIIGDGRLAQHIIYYFSLLNIDTLNWSRRKGSEDKLQNLFALCDRVLLLISDSALAEFVASHPYLLSKPTAHMSGSTHLPGITSAHPLNTFSDELYSLEQYEKTPIIFESQLYSFKEFFSELKNPHFLISPEKKALYHSLCVMSGNFTTLLWQNVFQLFEERLGLPRSCLFAYMEQTFKNLNCNSPNALTGPIARADWSTVIKNLDALRELPEQKLYYAFLNYVFEKQPTRNEIQNEYLKI